MSEGEHNGVFYPKDEIQAKINLADNCSIILDHKDTEGEGVSHWVGRIENTHWDIGSQGEGMYGDLIIVDKPIAQKLAAGAKWGVSPTIDFEKSELDDKVIASDLNWKSFSLVINPAIRATMLNSKQEGGINMPEKTKLADAELKMPYKYPKACMKKKDDEEDMPEDLPDGEMASIEVPKDVLEVLQGKDNSIKELSEKLEKYQTAEKNELVANLAANEFLIGRLEAAEIDVRTKALMEKSAEILSELQSIIGDHAELQDYKSFIKSWLKSHEGKTIADAAAAWKKQKPKDEGKMQTDVPEQRESAALAEASLTSPDVPANRELSILEKNPRVTEADIALLGYLQSLRGV